MSSLPRKSIDKNKVRKWYAIPGIVAALGVVGISPLWTANFARKHANHYIACAAAQSPEMRHAIDSSAGAIVDSKINAIYDKLNVILDNQRFERAVLTYHCSDSELRKARNATSQK